MARFKHSAPPPLPPDPQQELIRGINPSRGRGRSGLISRQDHIGSGRELWPAMGSSKGASAVSETKGTEADVKAKKESTKVTKDNTKTLKKQSKAVKNF